MYIFFIRNSVFLFFLASFWIETLLTEVDPGCLLEAQRINEVKKERKKREKAEEYQQNRFIIVFLVRRGKGQLVSWSRLERNPKHLHLLCICASSTYAWSIKDVAYTMEYYSAIKNNQIMPSAATWMELATLILSEVSQKEKDTYHMISLISVI